VTPAGSFEADERIRLFCALRLPEATLDELVAWQREALEAPGLRPVARENLHVTLAFLGHPAGSELEGILGALREAAAAAEPATLTVRSYRETRSVGMLACDDKGGRAAALASDLQQRLEALGVFEPERRKWLPHVTVVRFRERPRLQPALPAPEPFVPSDAAAYLSRLRPGGAQYEVLESVEVGGR
jgi:RNA 2',3'-cyclic 3'-phosphodiesterase